MMVTRTFGAVFGRNVAEIKEIGKEIMNEEMGLPECKLRFAH